MQATARRRGLAVAAVGAILLSAPAAVADEPADEQPSCSAAIVQTSTGIGPSPTGSVVVVGATGESSCTALVAGRLTIRQSVPAQSVWQSAPSADSCFDVASCRTRTTIEMRGQSGDTLCADIVVSADAPAHTGDTATRRVCAIAP